MLMVLLDHSYLKLYDSLTLWRLSYCSVSLFILLSGITSFLSLRRHAGQPLWRVMAHHLLAEAVPYLFCVAVLQVMRTGSFNVPLYLRNAASFSYEPPYYFLLFYFELVVVSPLLYAWIHWCCARPHPLFWHLGSCAGVLWVSSLLTRFTYVDGMYGGAAYLLGGSYLFLFYLGMVLCACDAFQRLRAVRRWAAAPLVLLSVWYGACVAFQPAVCAVGKRWFPVHLNPPGPAYLLYALLWFGAFWCVFSLLEEQCGRLPRALVRGIAWLGRYSLYLFLYHLPVLELLSPLVADCSIWVQRLVLFPAMVLLPAALGRALREVHRCLRRLLTCAFTPQAACSGNAAAAPSASQSAHGVA